LESKPHALRHNQQVLQVHVHARNPFMCGVGLNAPSPLVCPLTAAFFAMWLEVTCFTLAGERQTMRMREAFLASVLSQDIAFFDTDATTGTWLQRMIALEQH
jgi:hypothetical protein